jgi:hypothetical protein
MCFRTAGRNAKRSERFAARESPADRFDGSKTPFRILAFPDIRGSWESSVQDVFAA